MYHANCSMRIWGIFWCFHASICGNLGAKLQVYPDSSTSLLGAPETCTSKQVKVTRRANFGYFGTP